MLTQESAKPFRSKWLSLLLWAALGCAALVLLLAIGLGVLVAPDLFFKVPPPEAVTRVARKESGPLAQSSSTATDLPSILVTTTSTLPSSALLNAPPAQAAPAPRSVQSELIAAKTGLPEAILAKRDELNREFSANLCDLDSIAAQAPRLSCEETQKRLKDNTRRYSQLFHDLHAAWLKDYRGRGLREEPSYQPVKTALNQYVKAWQNMYEENLLRHERWRELAQACEYDQWDQWPQAVYYWRRLGGWEGYKHIIGGSIYVRTRGYRILDPIRIWMPYKQFELMVGH